jgi:hypothetical protein
MMKPINKMSMDELAEFAVTLEGWEWQKGMVDYDGDVITGVGDEGVYICEQASDDDAFRQVSNWFYKTRVRPDLEDNATKGCVLAMVRKKHGKLCHARYCPEFGWFVDDGSHGPPLSYESVQVGYTKAPIYIGFEEEIHALIAALAKEEA